MSPEVVRRKVSKMLVYLEDLARHETIGFDSYGERHYEVERLLELLHETASDIVLHLLKKDHGVVDSSRAGFEKAAEAGLISKEMAGELVLAGGMRNILVHEYDEIDHRIVHQAIPGALGLYRAFLAAVVPRKDS